MWPEGSAGQPPTRPGGNAGRDQGRSPPVREPFGGKPQLLTNLHPSLYTGRALSQMTAGTVDCRPGRPAPPRSSTPSRTTATRQELVARSVAVARSVVVRPRSHQPGTAAYADKPFDRTESQLNPPELCDGELRRDQRPPPVRTATGRACRHLAGTGTQRGRHAQQAVPVTQLRRHHTNNHHAMLQHRQLPKIARGLTLRRSLRPYNGSRCWRRPPPPDRRPGLDRISLPPWLTSPSPEQIRGNATVGTGDRWLEDSIDLERRPR
jgi:hypothetical protein